MSGLVAQENSGKIGDGIGLTQYHSGKILNGLEMNGKNPIPGKWHSGMQTSSYEAMAK